MKILDSQVILAEIDKQIEEKDFDIVNIIGKTLSRLVVMGIYLTNDVCSGYGQDFRELGISVISSHDKISIILGNAMSLYKDDSQICQYISLSDDIAEILMIIQAVLDRIDQ